MHLIIGEMVASSLDVRNKRDFLVGSIAPDAAFSFERKVNFEGNVDKRTRPYELKQKQDVDPTFLQRWYSDFRKMNTKLLCHYDMGYLKDWLRFDVLPREIDDVTKDDLEKFIEEIYGDFEIIEKNKDCDLEVYKFNDIIEYINLSKSKPLLSLKKLLLIPHTKDKIAQLNKKHIRAAVVSAVFFRARRRTYYFIRKNTSYNV